MSPSLHHQCSEIQHHALMPNRACLTNIAGGLFFVCLLLCWGLNAPIHWMSCKWWQGMGRENRFQLAQSINIICLYALQSLYLCLPPNLQNKNITLLWEAVSANNNNKGVEGVIGAVQIASKGKTAMSIVSVIACFLLSNFLFTYKARNLKCVKTRAAQYIDG